MGYISDISSWDPESDEDESTNVEEVARVGHSLLALVRSKAAETSGMAVFRDETDPLVSDEINAIILELNELAVPAYEANLLAPVMMLRLMGNFIRIYDE